MIKKLTQKNKKEILELAYKNERANMFIIGSFNKPNAFKNNTYLGYYKEGKLKGALGFFGLWGSLVAYSKKPEIIEELVDEFMKLNLNVGTVPCIKKYGDLIIKRLKKKGIKPVSVEEQMMMMLKKSDFIDLSSKEVKKARRLDKDGIIKLQRTFNNISINKPITKKERLRTRISDAFLITDDKRVVSTCNLHAYSANYAQLGGVVTRKEYRNKGYAKKCVSYFCKYYFDKGFKKIVLFTKKDNLPAIKIYRKIGFKKIDDYVIGRYD